MNYLNLRAVRYPFAPKFMRKEFVVTDIEFVDSANPLLNLHLKGGIISTINTEWYHCYLVADVNCPRIEPDCAERGEE